MVSLYFTNNQYQSPDIHIILSWKWWTTGGYLPRAGCKPIHGYQVKFAYECMFEEIVNEENK